MTSNNHVLRFTKKLNPNIFHLVSFVCNAKAEDCLKPVFCQLYVIKDINDDLRGLYLVATDSKRLHIAPIDNYNEIFNEGFYVVEKRLKSEVILSYVEDQDSVGMFPNIAQVIPTEFTRFEKDFHVRKKMNIHAPITRMFDESAICVDYLQDLFEQEDSIEVSLKYSGDTVPFTVDYKDGRKAVIMPIVNSRSYESSFKNYYVDTTKSEDESSETES